VSSAKCRDSRQKEANYGPDKTSIKPWQSPSLPLTSSLTSGRKTIQPPGQLGLSVLKTDHACQRVIE